VTYFKNISFDCCKTDTKSQELKQTAWLSVFATIQARHCRWLEGSSRGCMILLCTGYITKEEPKELSNGSDVVWERK
jgi:hypothetical protein